MARPRKQGLDYFPLDVDIDQDDKIQLVEAVHGPVGFAIVIKLLMRIYKDGYYSKWTETEQLLFSKRVNVDINSINVCINDCVKWDLFDKELFESHAVLTSNGIQKRFLEAVGRRQKVEMVQEYLLLGYEDINVYKNLTTKSINANINSINDNINPQRIVKNSKEENSREQYTKEEQIAEEISPFSFYEKNGFGALTPYVGQKVNSWIDDLSEELIVHGMKIAVENGVLKWNYVESILKDWSNRKIKTIEEVNAIEIKRKQQQQPYLRKPIKEEKVPDWVAKQKADRAANSVVEDTVSLEYEEQKRLLLERLGVKE
ncbi:Lin1244/Lin1753 domain-containing protein [Paenisporosarcina sp. OV554]|uniref:Lin1244/Lin1753 domain-containing protein n=1 Tax=Paenisporosarcina sp. OV554 TaxID=2135694 RepID=UPI000D3FF133|nr:Lin1244/Lin1753 domain-containing protein [Paenisporosarcina sp. OV554]PUB12594.1 DnaD/phage-associated family protein [Paenisporosarcina sp. OV554]